MRIGGGIKTWQFVAIAAAMFLGLLLLWWLATANGWVQPLFLTSPQSVWDTLVTAAKNGQLWDDIGVSAYRIGIGFLIATPLAIVFGTLVGCFRPFEAAIEPLVDFIRYMPVVAFVPLTIVWLGTSDVQKFVVIFIGTFFQQVLMIADNTRRVPRDYIDIGRSLGMGEWSIVARIVLPSTAPSIWDTMRITLGWAWTWVVLAEVVAASSGLGYRIILAERFFDTSTIIAYILVLGVLGLCTDQLMKLTGHRLFRYLSLGRG